MTRQAQDEAAASADELRAILRRVSALADEGMATGETRDALNDIKWLLRDAQPVLAPNGQPEAEPAAAFTPGPWSGDAQEGPPGHCIMAQVWAPSGKPVADVEPTDDPAEATANARLIAAAPDLLAALRVILAETRALGRYVSDETEDMARAAIAKALTTSAPDTSARPAMPREQSK